LTPTSPQRISAFIGKNWARGLTAEEDERVARSARARKGRSYPRLKPNDFYNWWRGPRVEIGPIPWSPEFAYAVGLMATDGWVSIRPNGYSNMGFSSKDRVLVETLERCLGLSNKIRERHRKQWGKAFTAFEITFSSVRLVRWFDAIGIKPRKSRTLGGLAIPDDLLMHTVRGLLDGDG
jgi:LAGLIDADG DNA endonuclease family protein